MFSLACNKVKLVRLVNVLNLLDFGRKQRENKVLSARSKFGFDSKSKTLVHTMLLEIYFLGTAA